MLDLAALTPQALAYYQALPLSARISMDHSNLTLRTLEDLKDFQARSVGEQDAVLYRRLPEPAVPSNAAPDPLDSE